MKGDDYATYNADYAQWSTDFALYSAGSAQWSVDYAQSITAPTMQARAAAELDPLAWADLALALGQADLGRD